MASETKRSPEQVREQYEIEKALAAQLRAGTRDERKRLYGKLYDELCRRVPHHPLLTRKASAAETERDVKRQLRLLARFISKDTTYLEVGPGIVHSPAKWPSARAKQSLSMFAAKSQCRIARTTDLS